MKLSDQQLRDIEHNCLLAGACGFACISAPADELRLLVWEVQAWRKHFPGAAKDAGAAEDEGRSRKTRG